MPGYQDGEGPALGGPGGTGVGGGGGWRGISSHHRLPDTPLFPLENPNKCLISKGQREGPGGKADSQTVTQEHVWRSPQKEYDTIRAFSLGSSSIMPTKMMTHCQTHEQLSTAAGRCPLPREPGGGPGGRGYTTRRPHGPSLSPQPLCVLLPAGGQSSPDFPGS